MKIRTWFEGLSDKVQHFLVCLVSSLAVGLISPFAGFVFAMGLGFGKEFGDSRAIGNHWDWKDVTADLGGAVLGTGGAMLFRFLCSLLA